MTNAMQRRSSNYDEDGWTYSQGYLENLKVTMGRSYTRVKGSLHKYVMGNNIERFGLNETIKAFEKLNIKTGIDWSKSDVTQIDTAVNLITERKTELYFHYLQGCKGYERWVRNSTLYYENGNRTICFYDKVIQAKKEAGKFGLTIEPNLIQGNISRFEVRYEKRLHKQFNRTEITASTLVEPEFYADIQSRIFKEYTAIRKMNEVKGLDRFEPRTPKEAMDGFLIYGLGQMGIENALHLIEVFKDKKAFNRKEDYSRLKRTILEKFNSSELTAETTLINELNQKMEAAKNE